LKREFCYLKREFCYLSDANKLGIQCRNLSLTP
jgi:hypothetical protein